MKTSRPLVLASSSPRRQFLMKEAGFDFAVKKPEVEEDFPGSMPVTEVAVFLARKKADYFRNSIRDEIIITADTVVVLNNHVLNKPNDKEEAVKMLTALSGRSHTVITGVGIVSKEKEIFFQDITEVTFKNLSREEILYYVDNYKPYDKAGAYGAQDWIGMVAIEKINGSYFNVMGLPIHKVHSLLTAW